MVHDMLADDAVNSRLFRTAALGVGFFVQRTAMRAVKLHLATLTRSGGASQFVWLSLSIMKAALRGAALRHYCQRQEKH